MLVLVTGSAGFIGFHTCKKFLENNYDVIGIDNLNSYYSVKLKKDRIKSLKKKFNSSFKFFNCNIINKKKIKKIFIQYNPKIVIHLAAQAGVRYSIDKPEVYIESNIKGFFNIINISRKLKVKNFLYASSSSVYGNNNKFPLSENDNSDNPLSLYAATKKSNELIAKSYFNIYGFGSLGMRFFTVYGPYGRPDMLIYKLFDSIYYKKKIKIFNKGDHYRDFTYIDDIVECIYNLIKKRKLSYKSSKIVNIGRGQSISLFKILNYVEKITKKKLYLSFVKMQKGDVKKTHSSLINLKTMVNYKPKTNYKEGILNFLEWYKRYHKLK